MEMKPTMPLLTKSPTIQSPGSDTDADRFKKSLRELKDLRSQLYHAADYCENSFLKTTQKKTVLENTRNYVCEVIVTVVDHLGTVSSNLQQRVYGSDEASQTEQRIDCMNQRLLTCQQYAASLNISSLLWINKFPSHHRRYISSSASGTEPPAVLLPTFESPPRFLKPPTSPIFGSPHAAGTFKLGSSDSKKKRVQEGNLFMFLRRSSKRDVDRSLRRMSF